VIAVGKALEERLKHPRRRGKSMQQENRRRVFRTRFSVKDGDPIDLDRVIKG
jgi:hypothetical protein